jgi:hypothetical protein
VVHGIHNLAWAANAVLLSHPLKVANIRARFLQPLYLDETASVQIRDRTDTRIEFEIVAANTAVALIKLSSQPGKSIARSAQLAPRDAQWIDLRPSSLQVGISFHDWVSVTLVL